MKKIVRLTENDITRIVKRVMNEDRNRMERLVLKCADETSQDGYDDPYDWMSEVFDSVEWELMDEYDNDELSVLISDLKEKYDDVLLSMWGE